MHQLNGGVNSLTNRDPGSKSRDARKIKQNSYKEMLDNQIQFNKGLRMYGNMTKEEKQLNKEDLLAY